MSDRNPASSQETSNEGKERGPKWYDQTFQNNDHWKEHYTKSRYYPIWTVIADRLIRAKSKSVLDIGCGSGQVASLLRDKGLARYLGLDFSSTRIQQAREVCPEFDFVVADAFQTDLLDAHEYDTVVCTEFLEHVNRDLEIVDRIHTGSYLCASVPSFPYKSHVRHFENEQQIRDRYAGYFQAFNVDSFLFGDNRRTLYVIEGTKL